MKPLDGRSRATPALDAWANLARAILVQAIKDYKHTKYKVDCRLFFESPWFEDYCDLAGYNPVALRDKLHIHLGADRAADGRLDRPGEYP